MQPTRILALVLLCLSLVCGVLSIIMAVSPFLVPLRLADGTTATPGMGVMSGLCMLIPALILVVVGGVLWFRVAPERRAKATQAAVVDQLREEALQTYFAWLYELQLGHVLHTDERGAYMRDVVRARTLALLALLDTGRKHAIIHFLSDAQLMIGPDNTGLSAADLAAVDLALPGATRSDQQNAPTSQAVPAAHVPQPELPNEQSGDSR